MHVFVASVGSDPTDLWVLVGFSGTTLISETQVCYGSLVLRSYGVSCRVTNLWAEAIEGLYDVGIQLRVYPGNPIDASLADMHRQRQASTGRNPHNRRKTSPDYMSGYSSIYSIK